MCKNENLLFGTNVQWRTEICRASDRLLQDYVEIPDHLGKSAKRSTSWNILTSIAGNWEPERCRLINDRMFFNNIKRRFKRLQFPIHLAFLFTTSWTQATLRVANPASLWGPTTLRVSGS
ncbi:unnamed protein product, partial [Onchocerca flexuosa]|uniref:Uncharacterized protein n=1 Tax=Onchocerca flexuosa TaxID=387005 RepID=A0A183HFI5_9BILA